ncbi:formate dehydrogenase subunit delta [Altererythrobacter sp.]|uniref:formate dehydrogenase subunit delta n=1 Tax=Altererythrobacter sp. TaxID=1872480 RepID=UPI003CFD9EA7
MDIDKLSRMANQIAANFEANGHDKAVEDTATHILKFWDPRMKAQIFADDLSRLSPIASQAVEKLKADAEAA